MEHKLFRSVCAGCVNSEGHQGTVMKGQRIISSKCIWMIYIFFVVVKENKDIPYSNSVISKLGDLG